MEVDLARFFQVCNPSKTLIIGNVNDHQYYMDFSSVRGGKIIEELGRTITRLSPSSPTCQLFTGHIGCGKSTELLRLKAELEQQEFHVVYFESSQDLDMADVEITDILLAITRQVSQSLEAINIYIKPKYFQVLFSEIIDFFQTPIELAIDADLSTGIANITSKTKDSPVLRSRLRQYLEPRTSTILEAINQEFINPAKATLNKRGKRGLVVIVDNLDRLDNYMKPSGFLQPEYLFVERGEQLNKLNCHVVYTIPLMLIFSNALGRLTNQFGVDPKVLPMVPVKQRDNSEFQKGIELLQQMVMARAFPSTDRETQLCLITRIFDSPETLKRLCKLSGGHLRNLMMLLYRCLQQEDPPISYDCLETVVRQRRNELTLAITVDEWKLLHETTLNKRIRVTEEYKLLIRNMFVYEYRDYEGSWFDINPVLAEAKELN